MIRIFLAHASEDKKAVTDLYQRLKERGFRPWLDKLDLLPGQNWRAEIPKAIRNSDVFLACLSRKSVKKKGYIQREFKMALNEMADRPPGEIYLIPVRLDNCDIPELRQEEYGINLKDFHVADLSEPAGFEQLVRSIQYQYLDNSETEPRISPELLKFEPLRENEKRNAIVIIGLGGTGKTTLINRLSSNYEVDPKIITPGYYLYRWTEAYGKDEPTYKYYVTDYQGQNIGTLIRGLMLEQKIAFSPLTFGAINSLIFVVDIARPDYWQTEFVVDDVARSYDLTIEELQSIDIETNWQERVQLHIRKWSPIALDLIFGFTTKKPLSGAKLFDANLLKYVCLFINKTDLLLKKDSEIIKAYEPLITSIKERCAGVHFELLLGSAETGAQLPKLKSSLQTYSWPKDL